MAEFGGLRYEIQFHTPESFVATHETTHGMYEERRDPTTTPQRKLELDLESELIFVRDVPIPARIGELQRWVSGGEEES